MLMNKRNLVIILFIGMLLNAIFTVNEAFAARGVVVYKRLGCSYYIVETHLGYAILEWFGGNDPSQGDVIVGDFETFGMKDIYNETMGSESKAWIDNFWLSKDRATEIYFDKCH